METPQFTSEEIPPKKNQTLLIVAVVVILLCCCCIVLAVAGYFGFVTIRSTETQAQPFGEETPDFEFAPAEEYEMPGADSDGSDAPAGGLGNDILRNDTWNYIGFVAMGLGCDEPIGPASTIEVLQEPADGVWLEKWTVACASGDTYPFEVEFIIDDTGTTFNITSLP